MTDRISYPTSAPATTFYVEGDLLSQSVAGNYSVIRCYLRAKNGPGGSTASRYDNGGYQAGTITDKPTTPAGVKAALAAHETAWTDVTVFGTGWSATAGYPPQVRRQGSRVDLRGAVTIGAGGSFADMLTIPLLFRPIGNSKLVGAFHASVAGVSGELFVTISGTLTVPGSYRTGSASAGTTIPIAGFWHID